MDTYKSYTGYANVPDLKDDSGNFVYYCKSGSTVATMVFISDAVSYTHLDVYKSQVGGDVQAAQDIHEGGLAGAGLADDGQEFSPVHGEGDAVQC